MTPRRGPSSFMSAGPKSFWGRALARAPFEKGTVPFFQCQVESLARRLGPWVAGHESQAPNLRPQPSSPDPIRGLGLGTRGLRSETWGPRPKARGPRPESPASTLALADLYLSSLVLGMGLGRTL